MDLTQAADSLSGSSWESWIQEVGKGVIGSAVNAKYNQPYQLQQMQLQAYGPYGQPYIEGMPNVPGTIAGIPKAWLLIGGALALVVVLVKN
jgi:hypothetical protein